MSASEKHSVKVYLYDLSQGMARTMSPMLLGKTIDCIPHTGIVVYGIEYFYGGGIVSCKPGMTAAGRPYKVIDMGHTQVPQQTFHDYLREVAPQFSPDKYDLLTHNCNNFTDTAAEFLVGFKIPRHITGLPAEFLSTPLGQQLSPMISGMQQNMMNSAGGGGMIPGMNAGAVEPILPRLNTGSERTVLPATETHTREKSRAEYPSAAPAQQVPPSATASARAPAREPPAKRMKHSHNQLGLQALPNLLPMETRDKKAAVYAKLVRSNSKKKVEAPQALTAGEEAALDEIIAYVKSGAGAVKPAWVALFARLGKEWPTKALFPVASLLRCVLSVEASRAAYGQLQAAADLFLARSGLTDDAGGGKIPSTLVVASLAANALLYTGGLAASEDAVAAGLQSLSNDSKNIRICASTLLYNISMALPKDMNDSVVSILSALGEKIVEEKHQGTRSRIIKSIGSLLYCNCEAVDLAQALEIDFQPQADDSDETQRTIADIKVLLEKGGDD